MLDNRAVSDQWSQGTGSLSEELSGEMMAVLGVPYVPRVFGVLESFGLAEEAWAAVRMNMMSKEAENKADQLRLHKLEAPPLSIDWRNLYSPGSFEHLRSLVNSCYEANPKLLFMVSLWVEGLSGRSIRGKLGADDAFPEALPADDAPFSRRKAVEREGMQAVKLENALSSKLLLNEISDYHANPGTPDDYKLLIAYPEFLRIHWGSLKPHLRSPGYAALKRQMIAEASTGLNDLPYGLDLNGWFRNTEQTREERELRETEKARLLELLYLIQDQLAGLILEMSFIRGSLR